MADKVEVKIVGDESSAQAALRRSAAAVTEASNVMRDRLGALGQTSKTAFNGMGADADHAADQIEAAKSRISNSMEGMKSSLDDARRTIKNTFVEGARQADDAGKIWEDRGQRVGESLRSSLATVKGALLGYVAALGTQAVGDAIAKGLEYASSLGEQAQQLGITSDALQEYHYAASQVGISNGEMSQALSQLTRRIGEAAAGNRSEADAFTKLGIAVKGANGEILNAADAIPLIADRLESLESPAERAAVLMDLFGRSGQKLESMLQGGSAAVNGLRNAAHELGIVLSEDQIAHADETADRLSAVKQVLEARIAGIVSDNANAILSLANALASVVDWAGKAVDAYRRFKLEQGLREAQAMQTGWFRSDADRAKGANDEQLYKYELAKLNGTVDKTGSFRDYRTAGLDIASPSNFLGSTPRAAGAGRAARGGGGSKAKDASGPSEMDIWRTTLSDGLLEEEQAGRDTLAYTAQFWREKLALTKAGSKEHLEVKRELARAEIALSRQQGQEEIANIRQMETLKAGAVQTDIDLARLALQEKLDIIDAEREAGALSAADALRQKAATNREMYQLDLDLEQRLFEVRRQSLDDQARQNAEGTAKRREFNRQIEVLEAQHLNRMAVLRGQAELKLRKDEQQIEQQKRAGMAQWTQAWSDQFAKLVTLQQGFASTVRGIWDNLVGMFEQAVARMVQQWLLGLLAQNAASTAAQRKEVLIRAKEAAAGAFSSVVKIPIVGPILAPAAAAAAFAATVAYSAKDGYDVPNLAGPGVDGRGGQLGVVHPREMVLPADLADIVRNGGMGGGISVHISAMDGQSVKRVLMDNKGSLAEALRKHLRDGGR